MNIYPNKPLILVEINLMPLEWVILLISFCNLSGVLTHTITYFIPFNKQTIIIKKQ